MSKGAFKIRAHFLNLGNGAALANRADFDREDEPELADDEDDEDEDDEDDAEELENDEKEEEEHEKNASGGARDARGERTTGNENHSEILRSL
jgi:hypothetical protein